MHDLSTGHRILIVEDDALQAEDLRSVLVREGFHVVGVAHEFANALLLAMKERPDLAIVDVGLIGDIDGITTARHMFEQYNIPIIFLTAFMEDAVQQGREFASGFLNKPYSHGQLKSTIREALQ